MHRILRLGLVVLIVSGVGVPVPVRAAETADVCVYGGTSGGVVAAVQAARMGKTAILLEPGRHFGGMTSGGLSAVDIGDPRTVGGLTRAYFTRLASRYGKKLPWDRTVSGVPTGGAFTVEPHAAEELFEAMVKDAGAGVRVLRDARLRTVKKAGARITTVVLADGRTAAAKMFIDASYEGDLLAAAGVSTVVGREANAMYGETLNGWRISQPPLKAFGPIGANGRDRSGRGAWMRTIALDPHVEPGKPESGLLPLISPRKMGTPGAAAPGVQAYCYRLCLTDDPSNRLPIAPPMGYAPKRYELLARYIAACQAASDPIDMRWFCMPLPLPNRKYDFNTAWIGANLPGAGWGWAEATWSKRTAIAREHEDYQRGLLHFLTTDPRVPANVRAEFARFGLPKDEFKDTGGWPHQLYIREARRMVSAFVMTEHHAYGRKVAAQPVALASYGVDAHEAQRIAHGGIVVDEGKLMGHGHLPGPYPIGYGAIVPRAEECDNLFATFCISASHVCFASTRMEPVLMMLSQSAATAACLAIDASVPVQKVDYPGLRRRLVADGQVLQAPAKKPAATPLPVLAARVTVNGLPIDLTAPPAGLAVRKHLTLLTAAAVDGQVVHRARRGRLFETRATVTPDGDFLLMFPEGEHYGGSAGRKCNDLLAVRSTDGGKTWGKPTVAFDIPYNQHGFIPLIPRGSKRLYAFGTQPIPEKMSRASGQQENAPIGYRHSDDDGKTWSEVTLIEPVNDPGFRGMAVMRMTETDRGTWILGAHAADWSVKPLTTRQYLLRSEDQGKTWTVLPDRRPNGWFAEGFGRMDEGRPLALGGDRVLALFRTPTGRLWSARSDDDGRTWTKPAATPLVHPDAPPMLFLLSDGKTLAAFHHNRHARVRYEGLSGNIEGMKDRGELWLSLSRDQGRTWSEPRFVLANAAEPTLSQGWYNFQCSYLDAFSHGGVLHLFVPHRWQQALHLRLAEADLPRLPTRADLAAGSGTPGK